MTIKLHSFVNEYYHNFKSIVDLPRELNDIAKDKTPNGKYSMGFMASKMIVEDGMFLRYE